MAQMHTRSLFGSGRYKIEDITNFIKKGLFLPRQIGLFPMDNKYRLSKLKALMGVTVLTVNQLHIVFTFYKFVVLNDERLGVLYKIVGITESVSITLYYMVNFFLFCTAGYSLAIGDLTRVDKEMKARGEKITYDIFPMMACGAGILSLIFFYYSAMTMFFSCKTELSTALKYTVHVGLTPALGHLLAVPIALCLHLLRQQFDHVKRALQKAEFKPPRGRREKKLEKLVDVHSALCDIGAKIDGLAGFRLLFCSALVFMISVSSLYGMIILFRESNSLCNLFLAGANALWILFWCLHQLYFVSLFVSVVKESKEFNSILFELIIEDETDQLARNEKLQLHIAMKRVAYFSACGLFPIDYTLIHSMIAAATTYLVILVQFEDLS